MTTANDIITYLRTHLSDLSPDEMAMVRPYLAEYGEGEGDTLARLFDGLCEYLKTEMVGLDMGWPWRRDDRTATPTADGRGSVTYTMQYLQISHRPTLLLTVAINHPNERDGLREIRLRITPLHVMQGGEPYLWCVEEGNQDCTWTYARMSTPILSTKLLLLHGDTHAAVSGSAYAEPEDDDAPF